MDRVRNFSRFLRAHGWTWSWAVALLGVAVMAGLTQRVTLPVINPDRGPVQTLETIGTLCGLPLAAGIAVLFTSHCPQFESAASARLWPSRAALALLAGALCVGACVLVTALGPTQLVLAGVARTYLLIVGVHLVGVLAGGSGGGYLAGVAFVASQSVVGLVPWHLNVLFNPALTYSAWVGVGCAWAVVVIGHAAGGPRRRG